MAGDTETMPAFAETCFPGVRLARRDAAGAADANAARPPGEPSSEYLARAVARRDPAAYGMAPPARRETR